MKKIALVTGSSRGIGRAIATELARAGYAVCINYLERKDKATELAELLTAEGCTVITAQADVSDRKAVNEMVAKIKEKWGPVSLLVNNAGVAGQCLFQDITDEMWNRYFGVNLNGAFHTIQAVLPDMLHEHEGNIINVSSIWGLRGASCEVTYSCTKHALIGLTRSLAMELAPSGIRVNCIAPGVIRTDMLDALPDGALEQLAEETPVGRLGLPEEISGAAAFLASEKAAYITGQVLTIDGGFIG
ncbi:MAG: 3-oxoacyl-ACP reductase FabG [Oscillospiraceae bacterium]|nr:3-oxoacyl-ACP reductase FabG [Oscillospiraceae bacterium]